MQNKIIPLFSALLLILLPIASISGLLIPSFYTAEKINWQVQSTGQDIINLFVLTPCIVISAWLAQKRNRAATVIWGGCMLYVAYTFTIYCFDIHFNRLFIVYCLCLCFSFYGFIYFIIDSWRQCFIQPRNTVLFYTGIYFIITGLLFCLVWLSEIIPATWKNTTPHSLVESGLFTNGVQVLDLSIVLPAIITTGILLLKKKRAGVILAPLLLVFFILMDFTIIFLQVILTIKGLASSLRIAYLMIPFTLVCVFLLQSFLKNLKSSP